jgi:hypothetical protein
MEERTRKIAKGIHFEKSCLVRWDVGRGDSESQKGHYGHLRIDDGPKECKGKSYPSKECGQG